MQGQANKWVNNLEAKNGLRVLNLTMADMLRQMENAIQLGQPVLGRLGWLLRTAGRHCLWPSCLLSTNCCQVWCRTISRCKPD